MNQAQNKAYPDPNENRFDLSKSKLPGSPHQHTKPELEQLVVRFNDTMAYLERHLVGYDEIIEAAKYALLTRQHMLIEGQPGCAKSYFCELLLSRFSEATVSKIQGTAATKEDQLVGLLMIDSVKQGSFVRNTKGYATSAELVLIDEIFRMSDKVLESLLNPLNEREFVNSEVVMKLPLRIALATTNFGNTSERNQALLERFTIQRHAAELSIEGGEDMQETAEDESIDPRIAGPKMMFDQLLVLSETVRGLGVHQIEISPVFKWSVSFIHKRFNDLSRDDKQSHETDISSRSLKLLNLVARTSALFDGRWAVNWSDLKALRYQLVDPTNEQQQKIFESTLDELRELHAKTPMFDRAAEDLAQVRKRLNQIEDSKGLNFQGINNLQEVCSDVAQLQASLPSKIDNPLAAALSERCEKIQKRVARIIEKS